MVESASDPPTEAASVGASGENLTLPASAIAEEPADEPACTRIVPVPTSIEVDPLLGAMYA